MPPVFPVPGLPLSLCLCLFVFLSCCLLDRTQLPAISSSPPQPTHLSSFGSSPLRYIIPGFLPHPSPDGVVSAVGVAGLAGSIWNWISSKLVSSCFQLNWTPVCLLCFGIPASLFANLPASPLYLALPPFISSAWKYPTPNLLTESVFSALVRSKMRQYWRVKMLNIND